MEEFQTFLIVVRPSLVNLVDLREEHGTAPIGGRPIFIVLVNVASASFLISFVHIEPAKVTPNSLTLVAVHVCASLVLEAAEATTGALHFDT